MERERQKINSSLHSVVCSSIWCLSDAAKPIQFGNHNSNQLPESDSDFVLPSEKSLHSNAPITHQALLGNIVSSSNFWHSASMLYSSGLCQKMQPFKYLILIRAEICHDRHNRQSCKLCQLCKFFQKTIRFLHLRESTRFTLNMCNFRMRMLKF